MSSTAETPSKPCKRPTKPSKRLTYPTRILVIIAYCRRIPRKQEDEIRDSVAKLQDRRRETEGCVEPASPPISESPWPLSSKPLPKFNPVRPHLSPGAYPTREQPHPAREPYNQARVRIVDMWSDARLLSRMGNRMRARALLWEYERREGIMALHRQKRMMV